MNGYLLNSRFVFARDRSWVRYAKYFTVAIGGLLLTELIIYIVHGQLGVGELLSKLIAVGLVFCWNYPMNRYWTFR